MRCHYHNATANPVFRRSAFGQKVQPCLLRRSPSHKRRQPRLNQAPRRPGFATRQFDVQMDREAPRNVAWDFSKIPLFPPDRADRLGARLLGFPRPLSIIEPKLVIGEDNDPLEHEADRVAAQVMSMPDMGAVVLPAVTQEVAFRECSAIVPAAGRARNAAPRRLREEHGTLLAQSRCSADFDQRFIVR